MRPSLQNSSFTKETSLFTELSNDDVVRVPLYHFLENHSDSDSLILDLGLLSYKMLLRQDDK